MDLLATVRKEGSRGGTGDFKWSDVQSSSRREHYLGHSVMAPVGRWQKGRDLNWYSKADDDEKDGEDPVERAARERKEEIRRVKEAEEDALARALGLPVAPRNNANMEPLGNKQDVDKALKENSTGEDNEVKGIGYGSTKSGHQSQILDERIEGEGDQPDKQLQNALKEYRRRHGNRKDKRHRSRSRSRERERRRSHRERENDQHQRTHRPRSRERDNYRQRSRSRSDSRSKDNRRHRRHHHRERSRSPYRHSTSNRDGRNRR